LTGAGKSWRSQTCRGLDAPGLYLAAGTNPGRCVPGRFHSSTFRMDINSLTVAKTSSKRILKAIVSG